MAGFTRQSTFTTDDTILAADHNNEYNQLVAAFNESTGHAHDGTAAEGPVIGLIGDAGITTPLNKILVDTANNNLGFWVDVSSVSVEQVIIQDGAVLPVTDNDIDLGSASKQFKDIYFSGTLYGTSSTDFVIDDATNSGVTTILDLEHTTSGTPANGIGAGLSFTTETAAGNNEVGTILQSLTTDVTSTSEDFDFVILNMAAGSAAAEVARVTSTGALVLAGGSITDSSGAISFGNENLTTTGTLASGTITVSSDLALATGSITSASGSISFGNENLLTTGTLGAGATTVTTFTSTGIDDNATAETLQIADTAITLGLNSGGSMDIVHGVGTGQLRISGGTAFNSGANLLLYGATHATLANDFTLRSGATTIISYDDSASEIKILDPTTIGSTSVSPDGTLHVHTATAGVVTADASADDLVVENSGHSGISILSPDASNGYIIFGTPTDNYGAELSWSHSTNVYKIASSKVGGVISLRSDNAVTNLTLSGASGSELATFAGNISLAGTFGSIVSASATKPIYISGGTANNVGANAILYAQTHATKANDFEFRSATTVVLEYDDSDNEWTIPVSDLTLSEGAVSITDTANEVALTVSATSNDGSSAVQITQLGTGRALNAQRNVVAATRDLVSIAQLASSGGAPAALHVQQADVDQVAFEVSQDGNAPTFDVWASGKVTITDTVNENAILVTSSATTGNAFRFIADSLTTGTGLYVQSNGMTTGKLGYFYSNSADVSTRNIVEIHNDNALATGATGLSIQQDSAQRALFIDSNADGQSIWVDSEATAASVVYLDTAVTTGKSLSVVANSLTTGSMATFISNSADTGTRNLVTIVNDNALATGATVLKVQQDSNNQALRIESLATTASAHRVIADSMTTGNIAHYSASGLTTGKIIYAYSNSASTGTRNLVEIVNDHASANNTTALKIQQDAAHYGLHIDQNGNQAAILIETDTTTNNGIAVTADSLTTGRAAYFYSNSADVSARNLVEIVQDNALATGAKALTIKQDAAQQALFIDHNADGIGIQITTDATTATAGINIVADSLTTGKCAQFYSNSGDTNTRNLVEIVNDNALAIGTTCLKINSDATGAGSPSALVIDSDSTDANVFDLQGSFTTTGNNLYVTGQSLTTGRVAYFTSNSSDASSRSVVEIENLHASATGAIPLSIQQDAGKTALEIRQNGNDRSIYLNAKNTTTPVIDIEANTVTTGNVIEIANADALTTGRIAYFGSNSSSTGTRNLVEIVNDNTLATGTKCLVIQQDSIGVALNIVSGGMTMDDGSLFVTSSSVGSAFGVVSSATTSDASYIQANALTTGAGLEVKSNSADTGTRNVVFIHNDHSSAVNVTPLKTQQDAPTSTNFYKHITIGALTIWESDGTTANGALSGTAGDICLNGGTGTGQAAYCTGTTNWTDM